MNVVPNFKTKEALIQAVAKDEAVTILTSITTGREFIEGPHGAPTWNAQVILKDGWITKVN